MLTRIHSVLVMQRAISRESLECIFFSIQMSLRHTHMQDQNYLFRVSYTKLLILQELRGNGDIS